MKPNRRETIVSNKPGPCPECSEFKKCSTPCDKVELWIGQEYVGRKSTMLLENGRHGSSTDTSYYPNNLDDWVDYVSITNAKTVDKDSDLSQEAWMRISSMRLSDKVVRFIHSYYMLGKRIRDIAIDENATSQAIDQRHIQAKKAVGKKLRQEKEWDGFCDDLEYKSITEYDICLFFFGKGYPRKVIAKILGIHVSRVIYTISNKYDELGNI